MPVDPNEEIHVCRHPGDGGYITALYHELHDFHFRHSSGGIQRRLSRPFLFARMSCAVIPPNAYFGHSCAHGDGPHDILVCITQVANTRRLYKTLAASARH